MPELEERHFMRFVLRAEDSVIYCSLFDQRLLVDAIVDMPRPLLAAQPAR